MPDPFFFLFQLGDYLIRKIVGFHSQGGLAGRVVQLLGASVAIRFGGLGSSLSSTWGHGLLRLMRERSTRVFSLSELAFRHAAKVLSSPWVTVMLPPYLSGQADLFEFSL